MSSVTDRLIERKRTMILDELNSNGYVDFTEANIYTIVLWILKNSGDYIDEQLLLVYEELMSKANCKNYKSNKRVFQDDDFRYNQKKPSHVYLDYRIILSSWGALDYGWSNSIYAKLSASAASKIKDLLTVAKNLGFDCKTIDMRLERYGAGFEPRWKAGKPQIFEYKEAGKQEPQVLFEVKAHKNGNLHIRMNQKLALAFNVEYGRLKGWLHDKSEACEELKDKKAHQYFKTNFSLLKSPFVQIGYSDNK
jgi:hypothetical protein